MQPLELMKRVSMASNLNKFIFMTLSYKLNKGKEKTYIGGARVLHSEDWIKTYIFFS